MRHLDPDTIPYAESHRYLLAGVAPRPIALVGSVDSKGNHNLSPFSFFNAFGTNPPVLAISPAYRGTDGTPKHSFLNIKETGEFTVSAVSYSMVEQISLASSDYEHGISEFIKSGLTPLPSQKIKAFGVAESPFVMECKLLHHIDFGGKPGSANMLIAEVVMFHIKESAFEGEYPSPDRLDLVARMGGPFYCRASGSAVFKLPKPSHNGIGIDMLPENVVRSTVLTGSDLARLAGAEHLPSADAANKLWEEVSQNGHPNRPDDFDIEVRMQDAMRALQVLVARFQNNELVSLDDIHRVVRLFLEKGDVEKAWACVMLTELFGIGMTGG